MSMSVQQFHEAIDRLIDSTGVKEQSCCKTCTLATCCNEPVYVGKDEVQWMLDSLTPEQIEEVKDRAREWSVKAVGTGMLEHHQPSAYVWLTYKIPCPFLKDRKCIAYDRRPMSCRMWFARDTPENCDMPGRVDQKHASIPPDANKHGLASMEYFQARIDDGTLHMDHLGVILCELLLGLKIPTGAKVTVDSMENA